MEDVLQAISESLDGVLNNMHQLQGRVGDSYVRGRISRTYDQINDAHHAMDTISKLQPLLQNLGQLESNSTKAISWREPRKPRLVNSA